MKKWHRIQSIGLLGTLLAASGCRELPGTNEQQGAVIGGASGAAVGAVVGGSEHRVLGALLGGVLGAGGGYLIGANTDKIRDKDKDSADRAVKQAQQNPATAEQALKATTADVNNDGFVTLDEVIAMEKAGLNDDQMLSRLRASKQVFELTESQRKQLLDAGVSANVVSQLETINREQRDSVITESTSGATAR